MMRVIDPAICPVRTDYPEKSLFVFDFDGVLIHQIEDVIARRIEQDGERAVLVKLAEHMGIHHDLFETPYLRHLVYQAAVDRPSAPHCVLDFARSLNDPYMILTARSGFHAIKKLFGFLERHALNPQEVFCVGRAPKTTQLEFLINRLDQYTICYFEDSKKHVDAAAQIKSDRLIITHIEWPADAYSADGLIAELLATTI